MTAFKPGNQGPQLDQEPRAKTTLASCISVGQAGGSTLTAFLIPFVNRSLQVKEQFMTSRVQVVL